MQIYSNAIDAAEGVIAVGKIALGEEVPEILELQRALDDVRVGYREKFNNITSVTTASGRSASGGGWKTGWFGRLFGRR